MTPRPPGPRGRGLIAAFDVGTSAAKGVLADQRGRVVAAGEAGYAVSRGAGTVEQAPDAWWGAVCTIARGFWASGHDPRSVAAVALTGQMQDVVVVDRQRAAVGQAILYADSRAGEESVQAQERLVRAGVAPRDAAVVDAASPLAKLLWLAARQPRRMEGCDRVLFGAPDYVLACLTGVAATDPTTAGTTACFDPWRGTWRTEWCATLGVPASWLPDVLPAGTLAGHIGAEAAVQTGFVAGTPVGAGMGDAAAATLAAGVMAPGAVYLYLGTSAWAAAVAPMAAGQGSGRGGAGLFYLPYVVGGTLIAAAPLLNAGNAHHWIMDVLGLGRDGGLDYTAFEALLTATAARGAGALFLPYLHGERCPVQEARPTGTFVRLGAHTGRGNLAWAVLEGICFSLRQVLEALGTPVREVRLVGGMTRGLVFRQLVADVCGVRVSVPALPATGGALAAAASVAVTLGWFGGIEEAAAAWFSSSEAETLSPDPAWRSRYVALYRDYCRIYPLVGRLNDAE